MSERNKIILKSGKEQSLRRYHPWIFSGAIKEIKGSPVEGDVVDVYSNRDEFLGTGHYACGSIAVRILSFERADDFASLLHDRISSAFKYRQDIGLGVNNDNNVFRLINAEGDGMPGLVVDYYDGTVIIQFHSVGMLREKERITEGLIKTLGIRLKSVKERSESTLPSKFIHDEKDNNLEHGKGSGE